MFAPQSSYAMLTKMCKYLNIKVCSFLTWYKMLMEQIKIKAKQISGKGRLKIKKPLFRQFLYLPVKIINKKYFK